MRITDTSAASIAGCVIAVVAGHVWPAQLGGHGGKGLAVALALESRAERVRARVSAAAR